MSNVARFGNPGCSTLPDLARNLAQSGNTAYTGSGMEADVEDVEAYLWQTFMFLFMNARETDKKYEE